MSRGRPGELPAVRLEMENEWAWCGQRRLELTPRAFAVLRHLVERAGRLVTKDELLTTLWRDAIVSDAALASCIRDLRKALRETSEAPRYIETVHRRGFRFIGPSVRATTAVSAVGARVPGSGDDTQPPAGPVAGHGTTALVGRDAELGRLRARLEQALNGQRQLVFVTGEPGIGKTALVEALLAEIGEGGALRIGRGQCVEQHGAGEPYLPVLEALGRLGRGAGGEPLVQILRQHAPTWLAQLPGLLADGEVEAVQRRAQGATRDRMLRELVEALEAVTRDAPLVLLLEDLHWSDSATIDLLGHAGPAPGLGALAGPGDVPAGGRGGRGASVEAGEARAPGARVLPGAAPGIPEPVRRGAVPLPAVLRSRVSVGAGAGASPEHGRQSAVSGEHDRLLDRPGTAARGRRALGAGGTAGRDCVAHAGDAVAGGGAAGGAAHRRGAGDAGGGQRGGGGVFGGGGGRGRDRSARCRAAM